jgi:hypothetical protein
MYGFASRAVTRRRRNQPIGARYGAEAPLVHTANGTSRAVAISPLTKGTDMIARRTGFLVLATVVAAAAPAAAGTKKPAKPAPPRVITISYAQPCNVSPAPTGGNGSFQACPEYQTFATLKGEKFASIEVTDASGQPGAAVLDIQSTEAVSSDLPTLICGKATGLEISGGDSYAVHPSFNVGDANCPTPATSGTIKITLTRK